MILSKRTLRQIHNLESACDFDMENAAATINIHFGSVSEIIDDRLSKPTDPVISSDVIKIIDDKKDIIPKEFKVNYLIKIEDLQGYDPATLEASFLRTVNTIKFREKTAKKTKRSRMTAFAVIGIILLIPLILMDKFHWFASYGKVASITIAFFLEFIFEMYFEDGIVYFTISRIYEKAGENNRNRINNIRLNLD